MTKMVIRLVIRSVIQLLGGKHFEVLVGVLDKMPASIWSVVVLFCCTYSDSMLDLMLGSRLKRMRKRVSFCVKVLLNANSI